MAVYDKDILAHYKMVAQKNGLDPSSTMEDLLTRQYETDLIVKFVGDVLKNNKNKKKKLILADVGCGNGYSLDVINKAFPQLQMIGFEYSPDLCSLAQQRFSKNPKVQIKPADIRDKKSFGTSKVDILISQRVIINLLDPIDQRMALNNLISIVNPKGALLFLEAFRRGLEELNDARSEFDMAPIPAPYHNLYLEDDFFAGASEISNSGKVIVAENFLSTHYFVTRVLHPLMLGDKTFKRNSHFVKFFSSALAKNVGRYSPINAKAFIKK